MPGNEAISSALSIDNPDTKKTNSDNQPVAYRGYNLFLRDLPLQEALRREGGEWARDRVIQFAEKLADPEVIQHGHLANHYIPELKTLDLNGERINEIHRHHSWHELMKFARANQVIVFPGFESNKEAVQEDRRNTSDSESWTGNGSP